jgi:hypothetical protein
MFLFLFPTFLYFFKQNNYILFIMFTTTMLHIQAPSHADARAFSTNLQMVLVEQSEGHWACDNKLVQRRHNGSERVSERIYATCMCSGTCYTPVGSATTATPH